MSQNQPNGYDTPQTFTRFAPAKPQALWIGFYHYLVIAAGISVGAFLLLIFYTGMKTPEGVEGLQTQTRGVSKLLKAALIAPFLGFCIGAAAACLFAPKPFYRSEVGLRWLGFIGTSNVIVGRIVCFVVTTLGVVGLYVAYTYVNK